MLASNHDDDLKKSQNQESKKSGTIKSDVVMIFKEFEACNFSNGFAVMRNDEEFQVDVWCRNLQGITHEEIKRGLIEAQKLNWAPSEIGRAHV